MSAEERVNRVAEPGIERPQLRERRAARHRGGDGRRSPRALGEPVQVPLQTLQRLRAALRERERVGLLAAEELHPYLGELIHDRVRAGRDEDVDAPRATVAAPEIVPRLGGLLRRELGNGERAHPAVVLVELGKVALVPIAADPARELATAQLGGAQMRRHLVGRF